MPASGSARPTIDAIEEAVARAKQQLVERFYTRPNDFFTESDLAAYLGHRMHVELETIGVEGSLVHFQYPTPFRCCMRTGTFLLKSEADRTSKNRKYRRGFFDVAVFNPAFLEEFSDNFSLLKGQRWEELSPVLDARTQSSEPAALVLFELMYNRDPFWADQAHRRGMATMDAFVKGVQLDHDKVRAACAPSTSGYQFARRAETVVFDSGLNEGGAQTLRRKVAAEVEVHSIALRARSPWTVMDGVPRTSARSSSRDGVPAEPGVYAWYRSDERVYVGKADSLRERVWGNHLGQGRNLGGSAFRRNVAEKIGFATSAGLKTGQAVLSDEQLEAVRAWILSCEVAWQVCSSSADALALEAAPQGGVPTAVDEALRLRC